MIIYAIYDSPTDHPGHFVVRGWRIATMEAGRGFVPLPEARLCDTLEEARSLIPPGYMRVGRQPEDQPHLVESWL